MKSKILWLTFAISIMLGSCCHTEYVYPDPPVFAPRPGPVVLVPDQNVNEYQLMVQDVLWMKWSFYAEWKAGIITEEDYNGYAERLDAVIAEYDKTFQKYKNAP